MWGLLLLMIADNFCQSVWTAKTSGTLAQVIIYSNATAKKCFLEGGNKDNINCWDIKWARVKLLALPNRALEKEGEWQLLLRKMFLPEVAVAGPNPLMLP